MDTGVTKALAAIGPDSQQSLQESKTTMEWYIYNQMTDCLS